MNKEDKRRKDRISRDLIGVAQNIRMELYIKNNRLDIERIKNAIKEILKY